MNYESITVTPLTSTIGGEIQHPMFQCRFSWRPNSIAFRDNRCSQHIAIWDYFPNTCSGFRVQVLGDKPV